MSRFTDLFQEPKAVPAPVVETKVEPVVVEEVKETKVEPVVVEEVKETKVTSILDRIKRKKTTD